MEPSHPLAPFKARLDRADESLRTFNREYGEFAKGNPLQADVKVDFQSGWNTAYIARAEPIPPRFSVLIGECLFHGRSALEHLIWAMVKANHKKPGKHNSFPVQSTGTTKAFMIDTNRPKKGRHNAGPLRGVPKQARTLIETLQPYHAPDAATDWLTVLNEMARDDRHRAPHGSWAGGRGEDVRHLLVPKRGVEISDYSNLLEHGRRLVPGTKLARFRTRPLTRNPNVYVEGDIPAYIAFGHRRTRLIRLEDFKTINDTLYKVIGIFEEFL